MSTTKTKTEMNEEQLERQAISNEDDKNFPRRIAPALFEDLPIKPNENPLVKIAPIWFKLGILSGIVGNIKYTIFYNNHKNAQNQPDYQLTISSSYIKTLENGEKEYSKPYQICGMWTQEDDSLLGSQKDSPSEYVLLRNEDWVNTSNLPHYYLYVRMKRNH